MNDLTHIKNEIMLKKVDFAEIPHILVNLKRDWPHSIHTYYFLLNFMNWTKQNWDGAFNVYCPNTSESYRSVMAVAKFKDIIQAKALKVIKDDKCNLVWLPPAQRKSLSVVELPSELYSQPLKVSQAKLINKYWGYSGPLTEVIVRDSLIFNGGIGLQLRANDSYVGWSVEQHYGGIGMLFVFPEFRRKGYAAALVKIMVKRVLNREIDPFGFITEDNHQSNSLFEKLKFEKVCLVHWIGVQIL